MKRKEEFILFAAAIILCFAVLLYNILNSPRHSAQEIPTVAEASTFEQAGKININTASAEELTALNNIGNARAQEIIEYREKNGRFLSAEELTEISGITVDIVEEISDLITF